MKSRFDLNKLKTAVFERTGQKISDNDPIFASVALSEVVLEEFLVHAIENMHNAEQNLTEIIGLIDKAGEIYKDKLEAQVNSYVQLERQRFEEDTNKAITKASEMYGTKFTGFTEQVKDMLDLVQKKQPSTWEKIIYYFGSGVLVGVSVVLLLVLLKVI
ncbi:MAG: hypothetical protein Q7T91_02105 [Sulfuricurvum sp.]|nr:hypothetical protein [Sulfuricurvum sp.]